MVKKMGQNPFEQKHKIDQLFKQRECLPKALPKIARCLKISRIILSYTLWQTVWNLGPAWPAN